MLKKVKYLLPSTDIDMGGIIVKQALPTNRVNQVDPFLLLHHGSFTFTDNAPAIQQGLGPHPHRGFTPVTFVIDGEVHHRDSRGNSQIAKKGEVQWMHAGAGIIHSERPSEALAQKRGRQEVIQLWINSPQHKKMKEPSYQYIPESALPEFVSDGGSFSNKLIAGQYKDLRGKIKTESQLLVIWSTGEGPGAQTLKMPKGYNTMIYVISGSLRISGYGLVDKENLLVFGLEGLDVEISCTSACNFLILAGEPIKEKVVQQGPFVMNSETEILQAMRDYQMGKMGILIEE